MMPYLDHRPWFVIKVLITSTIEHNTAIQISMGKRSYLILTNPLAINRLGELLVQYSQPKYRLLKWSVKGDVNEVKEPALGFLPKPRPPKIDYGRDGWESSNITPA